ncbi:MAG: DNA repair protein [Nitrosopumilus sp.]|uniref:DNA-3-methyladenine glycosylase 2 n=1 Tax=Nitrosopumilus sp. TaxID=2024843 RepID=UPI00247E6AC4|nr:DNA glycosylase [Nitrosopumilus sp.]MCV0392929.1 DNA repair protein [Nitrosopumilus sp.]
MQKKYTINVDISINSGQVFLWRKYQDYWYGVNGQNVLRIDNLGKIKSYQNKSIDFFRNKDNTDQIIKSISKDKVTKNSVKKYFGLRLMDQDPFQCLISFIVSSNSNIPKIKQSLECICARFGDKIKFDNKEFFLFPTPEKLSQASIFEIKKCGVGYRAKFIKEAAKVVVLKKIDFEELRKTNYSEAKKHICKIPGVGNKVADCVLLFSLNKLESFPLDRWMIKILEKYYLDEFKIMTKTITEKQYEILHEKIVKHFGPYAGFAQQFLFKMERENYKKKWL